MKRFLKDNGLTLAAFALFFASWFGQIGTGFYAHNDEVRALGGETLTFSHYLVSGHFLEATFENWESEFLQMGLFVVLSAFLYQRGSAESNPLPDEKDESPHYRKRYFKDNPVLRKLYENSLSIALFILFAVSLAGHAYGGWREENNQRALCHQPVVSIGEFISGSDFWFQSFQNWQSEFLSIGAIAFMTIYLRQKGSAQSKPVDAPHSKTEEGA